MRTLGIVGGTGPDSTAAYYGAIVEISRQRSAGGYPRLLIASLGGFAVVRAGAPVSVVFYVIAAAMLVYGSFTAWAVFRADWSAR